MFLRTILKVNLLSYFPLLRLGNQHVLRLLWNDTLISDSIWRQHWGTRLCSSARMRVSYSAVEGDMAASLICGRLTASLRNSGARNTLSSASKVSVCPRWSEGLRIRQVSVTAPGVSWRLHRPLKTDSVKFDIHWVSVVLANTLT